jgi:pyruvate kinase
MAGSSASWTPQAVAPLLARLAGLVEDMLALERQAATLLAELSPDHRESARNLLHYIALRRQDLRGVQEELIPRGLSSLGGCEAHVMATLVAVMEVLHRLAGLPSDAPPVVSPQPLDAAHSRDLLARSTERLFGPCPADQSAHIMVTMPSEAAGDRDLIAQLVAAGMNCMRVNCAHDDEVAWGQMIDHLQSVCQEQGRACSVLMDLGGPKVRTGPIVPGPAVIKWSPARDVSGEVESPARIWFHLAGTAALPPGPVDAIVPVSDADFEQWKTGDELRFHDSRGRRRRVRITLCCETAALGESASTAYVVPGLELRRRDAENRKTTAAGRVAEFPARPSELTLHPGDQLVLGDSERIGSPARYDTQGRLIAPAVIGCTLSSVLADIAVGDRIQFDDGRITARTIAVRPGEAVLEIVAAAATGSRLRADKGINLPDTHLHLTALTDKDRRDLDFVVAHADLVGYSFVRTAADVRQLQQELADRGHPDLPIVLKIENRQAFESLPALLLASLRGSASGVMIARGDLAVELGWERLAEVQEEILWMCEAAHLPVVWATQVLETLAKTGLPSRAEITDAAMAVRAECVMLNKGPHILEAVRVLRDILDRMRDHQMKKRPMLRRLQLAVDALLT